MTTLRAFHNDPAVKEFYLKQLQAHAKADQIVQGIYWEHGKGCAIGCTIHSDNHWEYEEKLGIPVTLAYIQDAIFEKLPNSEAKKFPLQFLEAIPMGADLSLIVPKLIIWLLADKISQFVNEQVRRYLFKVTRLYQDRIDGEHLTTQDFLDLARYIRISIGDLDSHTDVGDLDSHTDVGLEIVYTAVRIPNEAAYIVHVINGSTSLMAQATSDPSDHSGRSYVITREQLYGEMRDHFLALLKVS